MLQSIFSGSGLIKEYVALHYPLDITNKIKCILVFITYSKKIPVLYFKKIDSLEYQLMTALNDCSLSSSQDINWFWCRWDLTLNCRTLF